MTKWTLPLRKAELERKTKRPTGKTYPITIRKTLHDMTVCNVPIELPMYRVANGRTRAAQEEKVAVGEVPKHFFEDPDSDAAQDKQAEILWQMVEGSTLYDILKDQDQTIPLILTHEGYVVDGNRRLRAMRHFFADNPTQYQRFRQVRVVVLPFDFDESEIRILEAQMQVYPDAKEDYSWVDLALMKRALQKDLSEREIAAIYKEKEKDVRQQIGSLALAEEYLRLREKPFRYSQLPQSEHSFYRLYEQLQKRPNPKEREDLKTLAFLLIDEPKGLGNIFHKIPILGTHLPQIVDIVRPKVRNLLVDDKPGVSSGKGKAGTDQIDPIDGLFPVVDTSESLPTSIHETAVAQELRELIVDQIESIDKIGKQRKEAEAAYRRVVEASTALQNALTLLDDKSRVEGIVVQLDNINTTVAQLRTKLDELANSKV